jgi:hypothetical protein
MMMNFGPRHRRSSFKRPTAGSLDDSDCSVEDAKRTLPSFSSCRPINIRFQIWPIAEFKLGIFPILAASWVIFAAEKIEGFAESIMRSIAGANLVFFPLRRSDKGYLYNGKNGGGCRSCWRMALPFAQHMSLPSPAIP